jgi:hypothetical protein
MKECVCKGRPHCAIGKKKWYEKMVAAKKMKAQVVKATKPKIKSKEKPVIV